MDVILVGLAFVFGAFGIVAFSSLGEIVRLAGGGNAAEILLVPMLAFLTAAVLLSAASILAAIRNTGRQMERNLKAIKSRLENYPGQFTS